MLKCLKFLSSWNGLSKNKIGNFENKMLSFENEVEADERLTRWSVIPTEFTSCLSASLTDMKTHSKLKFIEERLSGLFSDTYPIFNE